MVDTVRTVSMLGGPWFLVMVGTVSMLGGSWLLPWWFLIVLSLLFFHSVNPDADSRDSCWSLNITLAISRNTHTHTNTHPPTHPPTVSVVHLHFSMVWPVPLKFSPFHSPMVWPVPLKFLHHASFLFSKMAQKPEFEICFGPSQSSRGIWVLRKSHVPHF